MLIVIGIVTRVQGRAARGRIGEGGGGANKSKKHQKSFRHDVGNGGDYDHQESGRSVENGGDSGERRKKHRNKVLTK